jgi:GntR family transcriptional regulator
VTTPKHTRLATTLRERIALGTYESGLPSESELMTEFDVSRTTVRTALTTLLNEGLLWSASGVGYFVKNLEHFEYSPQSDFRRRAVIPEADSFTLAAKERNPAQQIEVSIVQAPEEVARRLGVEEGDVVVVRRRVRLLDGVPYQLYDSYYPQDVVEGTDAMLPEDVGRGINVVLAENGFPQVRALDEIRIRMPNPEEVRRLQLGPGTPVAEHLITGFTPDDRVVRVARVILPGDRNVITFGRTHPDYEPSEPS